MAYNIAATWQLHSYISIAIWIPIVKPQKKEQQEKRSKNKEKANEKPPSNQNTTVEPFTTHGFYPLHPFAYLT